MLPCSVSDSNKRQQQRVSVEAEPCQGDEPHRLWQANVSICT